MTVTTGKYTNSSNLNSISEYINKLCIGREKAHHIWTEEVPKNIYTCIEDIRTNRELLHVLKKTFPNSKITNVREADEIYWAVSPKNAKGSDRSLVDCHYDAPFAAIPTNSTYYRIIVACNENVDVETQFPNDKINVIMNTGDFHGLDYNKDFHCVEGSIPKDKFRVLLKLHYLIVPDNIDENSLVVKLNYYLNFFWTKLSRWFMRVSAEPQNPIEYLAGGLVNISRVVFNTNSFLLLFVFGVFIFSSIYYRKNILKYFVKVLNKVRHL